jgi:hypothetical protein
MLHNIRVLDVAIHVIFRNGCRTVPMLSTRFWLHV